MVLSGPVGYVQGAYTPLQGGTKPGLGVLYVDRKQFARYCHAPMSGSCAPDQEHAGTLQGVGSGSRDTCKQVVSTLRGDGRGVVGRA